MYKFRLSIQALIIAYLCSALVACGGGSSSASTTAVTAYTITTTASTGGSVSPGSTTVNSGQTAKFTVSASSGYTVQSVTGCGGTLSGNTYTTGPVTANCTVNASFKLLTYTVTASAGSGGTITPASTTVSSGQATKFAVSANSGYEIQSVSGCAGTLAGGTYTTGPVKNDCTVSASFRAVTYTVTASAGSGGTITPPSVIVDAGQTTGFDVTANTGYAIQNVTGCGGTLSNNIYKTGTIAGNCGITADFSPEWTWEGGSNLASQPGVYGTEGMPAPSNIPSARSGAVTWTGSNGNVWLFGGSSNAFLDNDLWMYSLATHEWTWEGGSSTATASQPGVYGTQGVASATNMPGARADAAAWTDANGNLWMFGGSGIDSNGTFGEELNDLWMYSPTNHEWTWEGGSNLASQPGVYGTQGVASAGNVPSARSGAITWTGSNGNVWLFGGSSNAFLDNDLWMYSLATHEWTWEGGSSTATASQPGVYGTQGVASATNMPGARADAAAWTDANGNLWMFGGSGIDSNGTFGEELNDLWMFPKP